MSDPEAHNLGSGMVEDTKEEKEIIRLLNRIFHLERELGSMTADRDKAIALLRAVSDYCPEAVRDYAREILNELGVEE